MQLEEVNTIFTAFLISGASWLFTRYKLEGGKKFKKVMVNWSPLDDDENKKYSQFVTNRFSLPIYLPFQYSGNPSLEATSQQIKDTLIPVHNKLLDLKNDDYLKIPVDEKDLTNGLSRIKNIIDPLKHNKFSVDCVSCHNATSFFHLATSSFPFRRGSESSATVRPKRDSYIKDLKRVFFIKTMVI